MDKVAVFIDGGMFSTLTKKVFHKNGIPRKIHLTEFAKALAADCNGELFRTYIYTCPPHQSAYPTPEERQRKMSYDKYAYAIKQLKQIQLREGRLRKFYDESGNIDFMQKGVDVLLAIDMLKLSIKGIIQKAILVSSDSDFVPVVRAMRDEGIYVILYFYKTQEKENHCFSQDLFEECDERINFEEKHFERAEISKD